MNILVFSWRDPKHPLAGGAEQVMHEHMKGWVENGHSVTLFSSKFKNSLDEEQLEGIRILRMGYQYWGVQIAGFIYYIKNSKNFDLVVDQFHGIPFFTPIYVKKPILAVIQEPAREVWWKNPLPFPFNLIVGFIGYFGEPFLFLFFYRNIQFMTGSESAREDLVKLGVDEYNIAIVPHGVLTYHLKEKLGKEKIPTIIFLGVLSSDKGIEDAIRCFSILKQSEKFKFWVIGKPETKSYFLKVKSLVNNLKMQNDIKFWGYVSSKRKFELLSKSHILVNTSSREGWGLVNIEANSVGTPVVAYPSRGLVDSVKDGYSGIICKTKSPEDIANQILMLLGNKDKFSKLCTSARDWSNNFKWSKSKKISLNLVNRVATRS